MTKDDDCCQAMSEPMILSVLGNEPRHILLNKRFEMENGSNMGKPTGPQVAFSLVQLTRWRWREREMGNPTSQISPKKEAQFPPQSEVHPGALGFVCSGLQFLGVKFMAAMHPTKWPWPMQPNLQAYCPSRSITASLSCATYRSLCSWSLC